MDFRQKLDFFTYLLILFVIPGLCRMYEKVNVYEIRDVLLTISNITAGRIFCLSLLEV
jgi:hypothetical protein